MSPRSPAADASHPGRGRAILLVVDPRHVRVAWDVDPRVIRVASRRAGDPLAPVALRLHIGRDRRGTPAPALPRAVLIVGEAAGSRELTLAEPGASVRVEVGLVPRRGEFVPLVRTDRRRLPPGRESPVVEFRRVTLRRPPVFVPVEPLDAAVYGAAVEDPRADSREGAAPEVGSVVAGAEAPFSPPNGMPPAPPSSSPDPRARGVVGAASPSLTAGPTRAAPSASWQELEPVRPVAAPPPLRAPIATRPDPAGSPQDPLGAALRSRSAVGRPSLASALFEASAVADVPRVSPMPYGAGARVRPTRAASPLAGWSGAHAVPGDRGRRRSSDVLPVHWRPAGESGVGP